MEHDLQDSAKINSAYSHESAKGIRISPGPYVGIVKSNTDPLRSGKLQVWIAELGGDPDDHSSWRTVSYVTPFYGVTDVRDDKDYQGNPHSYGMWFVPPDIGVKVLCTFANGNPFNGFWFGCVPEWPSLHMVPGISAAVGNSGVPSPVVDFFDGSSTPGDLQTFASHQRNVHQYQEAIWNQQGLLKDPDRGPGTSSAFRETPSNVFGISTPGQPFDTPTEGATNGEGTSKIGVRGRKGGHTFIMDDGDAQGKNAMMRFRTSGGHMIMMNDTKDFIYVINSKGTGWVEINSQGDMNVYSGSKVNIFAQSEVNVETKGAMKLHGATVDIVSDGALNIQGKDVNILADGNAKMTGKTALHLKGKNSYLTGDSCLQIKSDGHIDAEGACHTINTKAATKATEAGKASSPQNMPSKEAFGGHISPPNPQAQSPYGSQQGQQTGAAGPYGAPNNFGNGGVQPSYGPMTNNIPPIVYTNNSPGPQGQGSPIGSYAPANYVQTGISYAAASLVQNLTYGGGAYFDVSNLSPNSNSNPEYSTGELQNNPGNLQYDSSDGYAVGFAHNLSVYARPEQGIAALITLFDSFAANPGTLCVQLLQQYLKASSIQDPCVTDAARYMQNNLGIGPTDYVALKDPTTRVGWTANIIKYIQGRIIYTYDQIVSGCALSLNMNSTTFLQGIQPVTQPWQNSGGANPYSGFVNPATNSNIVNSGASPLQQIGNQIISRVLNNVVGTVAADVGASVGNAIRTTTSGAASGANSGGVNLGLAAGQYAYTDVLGQSVGSGQCVALVQATSVVGQTSTWVPGTSVTNGSLSPGTVIATFGSNGQYQNIPGQSHAAIFLGYQKDDAGNITGIQVQDQWAGHACGVRTIPYGQGTAESGENFYAVTHDGTSNIIVNGAPTQITQDQISELTSSSPTDPPSLNPGQQLADKQDAYAAGYADSTGTTDARNLLGPQGFATNGVQYSAQVSASSPTNNAYLQNYTHADDPSVTPYSGSAGDRLQGDATGSATLAMQQQQIAEVNAQLSGGPSPSAVNSLSPTNTNNSYDYSGYTYSASTGRQNVPVVIDTSSQSYGRQNQPVVLDNSAPTVEQQQGMMGRGADISTDTTYQSVGRVNYTPPNYTDPRGNENNPYLASYDTAPNRDIPYEKVSPPDQYAQQQVPDAAANSGKTYDPTTGELVPTQVVGPNAPYGSNPGDIASGGYGRGDVPGQAESALPQSNYATVKPGEDNMSATMAQQGQQPITGTQQPPASGSAAPGGAQTTPGGSAATGQGAASC
jgi:hypothetical protein